MIDAAIQQALEDGNCLQVESTSSQVNQFSWRSYYHGNEDELRLSRAFSFSDRCRYYWLQPPIREEVKRLLHNLGPCSCPLTLLSQYHPLEYEAPFRAGTGR